MNNRFPSPTTKRPTLADGSQDERRQTSGTDRNSGNGCESTLPKDPALRLSYAKVSDRVFPGHVEAGKTILRDYIKTTVEKHGHS